MEWAAVDAFNNKYVFVQICKIYKKDKTRRKKVRFRPKNEHNFDEKENYAEMESSGNYRPVRIRYLGSKSKSGEFLHSTKIASNYFSPF